MVASSGHPGDTGCEPVCVEPLGLRCVAESPVLPGAEHSPPAAAALGDEVLSDVESEPEQADGDVAIALLSDPPCLDDVLIEPQCRCGSKRQVRQRDHVRASLESVHLETPGSIVTALRDGYQEC